MSRQFRSRQFDADDEAAARRGVEHDLAVAPEAAGAGCGSRLVDLALHAARREGLQLALVAVGDALAFWLRQGFRDAAALADAAQCAHLASYPGAARYLVRPA